MWVQNLSHYRLSETAIRAHSSFENRVGARNAVKSIQPYKYDMNAGKIGKLKECGCVALWALNQSSLPYRQDKMSVYQTGVRFREHVFRHKYLSSCVMSSLIQERLKLQ